MAEKRVWSGCLVKGRAVCRLNGRNLGMEASTWIALPGPDISTRQQWLQGKRGAYDP